MGDVFAISDLHVGYADNQAFTARVRPRDDGDWLIVAGDVAESFDTIVTTLATLRRRFQRVIWVPGNHELWTMPQDEAYGRGVVRYERLVAALREVGVTTPEDPYPVWQSPVGPLVIAPLFLLYDYSFRPPGTSTLQEALDAARQAEVLCVDEEVLYPDPYPSRQAWSRARLAHTRQRLDALPADTRTVLVGHWPLHRAPTERLWHPEFALWCGTEHTADWPVRYRAAAVVYGHLHIPVTQDLDGVPHLEVSLGYPREWQTPGNLQRRVVSLGEQLSGEGNGQVLLAGPAAPVRQAPRIEPPRSDAGGVTRSIDRSPLPPTGSNSAPRRPGR